ncbi:unnamed protein product [Allacma fusca]|uniref:Uncharacterized protein n=1 Tax=Allacma fusca TaxID=39272 RepID=A0A8J2K8G2_9HEXA|nr:unnamed protein product [Allacma fusca]
MEQASNEILNQTWEHHYRQLLEETNTVAETNAKTILQINQLQKYFDCNNVKAYHPSRQDYLQELKITS